ncbi:5'-methylthioadenosine/S-adenosylhomocysteine nucleosidase [Piscinibacter terrae]|nr:5'-methylthioadenosine/S-adenosylhomocysteine nucleosidase [Albitalea terrae]
MAERNVLSVLLVAVTLLASMVCSRAEAAQARCLTDCTPRIGIVSAFGQEADILVAQTARKRSVVINGNRFTTGVLRGNRVVIVLSGVSMINSTMVTQLMLDHFRVERLIMSGIAGGVNPAHHVGDVTIPERWSMPMEVYWNHDGSPPAPCGSAGDVSCLGLKLASVDGKPVPSFNLPEAPTGLFMRENFVMTSANSPKGEFRFDYPVDEAMMGVARSIQPVLQRCGPKAVQTPGAEPDPKQCVAAQPKLIVGGRGVSATVFLANPHYRRYLFEQLQAQTFEMETAAFAHVAYANQVPYIAFRSLSDLAGAEEFNADVGALFSSGLAEANASAVTLAFLDAWARQPRKHGARP